MAKKSKPVHMKKSNNSTIGTINMNELIINRKGKVNSGTNPEIRTKIHRSKKDYDRRKAKKELRDQLYDGY